MAKVQINRRVQIGIIKFVDNIRADNADMRRAIGHKGRYIKSAHTDNVHIIAVGGKAQRAVALVKKARFWCNACTF